MTHKTETPLTLTKRQSKAINLLKGTSMLMVLFIHANIKDALPGLDDKSALGMWTQVVTRILVDNAVPMFFLVSGFLFFLKPSRITDKLQVYLDNIHKQRTTVAYCYFSSFILHLCLPRAMDGICIKNFLQSSASVRIHTLRYAVHIGYFCLRLQLYRLRHIKTIYPTPARPTDGSKKLIK